MNVQLLDIQVRYKGIRTFLRIFGRNADGERVVVDVFDVPFYVYVDQWEPRFTNMVNAKVRQDLNSQHRKPCYCPKCQKKTPEKARKTPCRSDQKSDLAAAITKVEPVLKKSFVGYNPEPTRFWKLTVASAFLCRPITWVADRLFEFNDDLNLQWYESDVSPEIRFCTDFGIVPSGWAEVRGSRVEASPLRCKHHFHVCLDQGHELVPRPEIIQNSPIRTLAWDIECICMEPGVERFPVSKSDPVITIGCVLSVYGRPELTEKVVFQLDTCDLIEGTRVVACRNEYDLLRGFCEYFVQADVDILSGYNSDMLVVLARSA
tara:strand:- start:3621 stop:4577 length:957 start_codon:yes stop_codon:yes gene_type:complete